MAGTRTQPADPAPDTVRDGSSEQQEEELSLEDRLAADIKEEGVRIYEGEEVAKEPVSYLLSLRDDGIKLAKKARSAMITADKQTGLVADQMLLVRLSIRNPKTGLPDWGGKTKAYKDVVSEIIKATMTPDETPATVANRLQRRAVRKLPQFVAEYVNTTQGLDLDEDLVAAVVKDGEDATKTEDEDVRKLVTAVNEQFRVGSHDENDPYSPFEPSKGSQRTPATRAEQNAAEAARNLSQFRQNLGHLKMDVVTDELVLIMQEVDKVLHSKEPGPQFGKGRKHVAANLTAVHAIALANAKELSEQAPSREERETYERALAISA